MNLMTKDNYKNRGYYYFMVFSEFEAVVLV